MNMTDFHQKYSKKTSVADVTKNTTTMNAFKHLFKIPVKYQGFLYELFQTYAVKWLYDPNRLNFHLN